MHYYTALFALLPSAFAITHRITVGQGGNLAFSPERVTAQPGDILEFHYYPKNHSVTQSSFAAPCVPLADGINSGFVPVANATAVFTTSRFEVQVNDTKPLWFYCAQGKHCESGMSMVVNEPKTRNTLDAYQANAKNAQTQVNPAAPVGGTFSSGDIGNVSFSATTLTTYTWPYATYTTASNDATTTVILVETITAIGGQTTTSATTSSTSTSSTSSASSSTSPAPTKNAAVNYGAAGWAVAAGAAVFGGLMI